MLGGHGLPVRVPNSAIPCLSAWAWRTTLPLTSGWRPAQPRAARRC